MINQIFRKYLNILSEDMDSINDEWFKDGFKTFKIANPVSYEVAKTDGSIETLEGPVSYKAGFYIMTGPKGERYPITPEKFATLYNDNGDGTATPKKIEKIAKVADRSGVVKTSWGEDLHYNPDVDVIVRHGPGDYGVVKREIFNKTYDTSQEV